jgi:hypothetical protein
MRRALAFLVFGPALASVTALLIMTQASSPPSYLREFLVIVLFFFTLPVAALAGSLDAYLTRAFEVPLRAPLIAAVGAVIASGLALILFNCLLPPAALKFFAMGGAACMGACSLLANEYGSQGPAVRANSLLRN